MASETEAKEERPSSTLLSPSGPPLETETQGCNVCYCWQRLLRRGWSVLQQGGAEEAKDVPSIPPATEGEHAASAWADVESTLSRVDSDLAAALLATSEELLQNRPPGDWPDVVGFKCFHGRLWQGSTWFHRIIYFSGC